MTTSTMPSSTTPSSRPAQRRSILDRVNPRMIVFVLLLSAFPVWIAYMKAKDFIYGGIENQGDYSLVDLKKMGEFRFNENYGTSNDIPEKWRNLDGKRIMLEGFMYSPNSAGPGVVQFQFVYNIAKCCFSGPPLVQERVFARVPNAHMVMFDYGEMVKIVGKLHVKPEKVDGVTQSIYTMDVEKIESSS